MADRQRAPPAMSEPGEPAKPAVAAAKVRPIAISYGHAHCLRVLSTRIVPLDRDAEPPHRCCRENHDGSGQDCGCKELRPSSENLTHAVEISRSERGPNKNDQHGPAFRHTIETRASG